MQCWAPSYLHLWEDGSISVVCGNLFSFQINDNHQEKLAEEVTSKGAIAAYPLDEKIKDTSIYTRNTLVLCMNKAHTCTCIHVQHT